MISGTSQKIMISAVPYQTEVSIRDKTGNSVFKGVSPCDVVLARKNDYYVSISQPGYKTQEIPIIREFNGWFILNFLLGFPGIIGVVIDITDGSIWTLKPDLIYVNLITAQNEDHTSKTYAVVQYIDNQQILRTLVRELEKE
jgi:hypothetical protein